MAKAAHSSSRVKAEGWSGVTIDDAIIYELHIGTFTAEGTLAAAQAKLKLNAQKYPVDLARGSSAKYDQL